MDSHTSIRYFKHEEALEDTNNYKIRLYVHRLQLSMQQADKHPETDKRQGCACVKAEKAARQQDLFEFLPGAPAHMHLCSPEGNPGSFVASRTQR